MCDLCNNATNTSEFGVILVDFAQGLIKVVWQYLKWASAIYPRNYFFVPMLFLKQVSLKVMVLYSFLNSTNIYWFFSLSPLTKILEYTRLIEGKLGTVEPVCW